MLGDFPLPSTPSRQRGAGEVRKRKSEKSRESRVVRARIRGTVFPSLKEQTHL